MCLSPESSPSVGSDGTVYVGSDDNTLWAIAPNGTVLFTYKTGQDVTTSPAIGADGALFFGSEDGNVYALV